MTLLLSAVHQLVNRLRDIASRSGEGSRSDTGEVDILDHSPVAGMGVSGRADNLRRARWVAWDGIVAEATSRPVAAPETICGSRRGSIHAAAAVAAQVAAGPLT